MAKTASPNPTRSPSTAASSAHRNRHDLIAVAEWIPGKAPTDYEIDLNDGPAYETRYWRCRACGQERTHRREFTEPCAVEQPPKPLVDGGYSIDDARTRRAVSEDMTVQFVTRGPTYRVESESGRTYVVDVDAETCTCPDHTTRGVFCKHQRRVDLEIRGGTVPGPDGTFLR